MTKTHFELLAQILRAHITIEQLAGSDCTREAELIYLLMRALRRDNENFDRTRFSKAAGL